MRVLRGTAAGWQRRVGRSRESAKREREFERDEDGDWLPFPHGWSEPPLFHGFDGLTIEAERRIERSHDADRPWIDGAVGSHDRFHFHRPLYLGAQGVPGVLRFHLPHEDGIADAIARQVHVAADSAQAAIA